MGKTVDRPGDIKRQAVPHEVADKKTGPKGLTEEIYGHSHGDEDRKQEVQRQEVSVSNIINNGECAEKIVTLLVLKHDDFVGLQIGHVDGLVLLLDGRMLLGHQPSHVREEETPFGVVRIRIRVRELVVQSVIPHPRVHRVLS